MGQMGIGGGSLGERSSTAVGYVVRRLLRSQVAFALGRLRLNTAAKKLHLLQECRVLLEVSGRLCRLKA